jgi:beta-galactosidase
MRNTLFIILLLFLGFYACKSPEAETPATPLPADFSMSSRVDTGKAVSVMLTAYSTTLLANGTDKTNLRIAVTDSLNREIVAAEDTIRMYITGDGWITDKWGKDLTSMRDTAGLEYFPCALDQGICELRFVAGTTPDRVKIVAKANGLWEGGHEIHTIPADTELKTPDRHQLNNAVRKIDRMIGADISFLAQLEDDARIFKEDSAAIGGLELLKKHGFNYIRLRIFVEPENKNGYAPEKGYCNLDYTLAMAKRVKEVGLKLLLDFHYSDYWADPQQQNKPQRWEGLDFETLQDSVRFYTRNTLQAFKKQGLFPDMVQIGNEINHGLLWPEGHIGELDQLAELLSAGVEGTRMVSPAVPIMMHIALGGQNEEAVFWLDNMIARDVHFDIIGLSYYPRWHGTLKDLDKNLRDLLSRYKRPLNVVEYNDFPKEVHDIVFSLPDDMGKGACIWEPLGRRSGWFDENGQVQDKIHVYDALAKAYLKNK